MSLQGFFQWPIAIEPEKIKVEKDLIFIHTLTVIYPSPNLGLLYMIESKQNPKIPFGLCLYRLFAAKAPTTQSHWRFERKINTEVPLWKPSDVKVIRNMYYFYFTWYS